MISERKIISYIASSLDGFIAGPENNLDFLSAVETSGEDYGYAEFLKEIDTVVVGRKTYEKVKSMGFPYHEDLSKVYIFSKTSNTDIGNKIWYSKSPGELVDELRKIEGKNIYCDGGSEIINELINKSLLDEIIISIVPVLLGSGTPLFKNENKFVKLDLIKATHFKSGLVQLHYKFNYNK